MRTPSHVYHLLYLFPHDMSAKLRARHVLTCRKPTLATQVVPSDMLYCLWKVGRAIYELAEGYAEANEARAIDEAEARGEDVAKRRCVCSQEST